MKWAYSYFVIWKYNTYHHTSFGDRKTALFFAKNLKQVKGEIKVYSCSKRCNWRIIYRKYKWYN